MRSVPIKIFSLLLILFIFNVFLCPECASPELHPITPTSDETEFEKALSLVEGKKYSQAIGILERLMPKMEDPEMKNKCRYVIATCHKKLGHKEKAITYYQLVFQFSDLARLNIATFYRDLRDYKKAIEWYEPILRDHPGSLSAMEARYQLGECHYALKQYDLAVKHYSKFIEDHPAYASARVRMAVYKTGCAYQELKRYSEAYAQYQKLFREDMEDMKDWLAQTAMSKIKTMMSLHPRITISKEDRISHGLVLVYARKYRDAREEFEEAVDDRGDLSAKAAYLIAESYYLEKKYTTAIAEHNAVIKRFPQSEFAIASQYQIALCRWEMGGEEASNTLLKKFVETYPNSDLTDDARFQIAEHYNKNERYKEAAEAYGKVASEHPSSNLIPEALWKMGWCYIKSRNEKSEQAFRQLVDEYPDSQLAESARFWAGVSCERAGKWQAAVDIYNEVMEDGDWYYSERAKKRIESLVRLGRVSENAVSNQHEDMGQLSIEATVPAIPVRTQELLNLRVFDDAINELLMAADSGKDLESAYHSLSVCYEKAGDSRKSWLYAWKLVQLLNSKYKDKEISRQLYRRAYPMVYRDAIFAHSENSKLDPFLVSALIFEESRYNPSAVSRVGARGLTQIMPKTGSYIAKKLKIPRFGIQTLYQPETNIKMGTWYLSELVGNFSDYVHELSIAGKISGLEELTLDHSDAVRTLALGAYNGGETRVQRWVEKYGIKDLDEFVESIPLRETRLYVKKVCSSYEIYKASYKYRM